MTTITPTTLKQLRSCLRDGDITELVKRTGISRQTIYLQLKGDAITEATRTIVDAAKQIIQEHHAKEKEIIKKS